MPTFAKLVALFVLCCDVGVASAGAPAAVRIEVQIASPFATAVRDPLPTGWVQADGANVFHEPLVSRGNRMTHVFYGQGVAEISSDVESFVMRVRIDSLHIDESAAFRLSKGRFFSIAEAQGKKIRFIQRKQRPMFR